MRPASVRHTKAHSVAGVFGFPVAAVAVEVVAEGAVGADLLAADFGRELGNDVPESLTASGGEDPRALAFAELLLAQNCTLEIPADVATINPAGNSTSNQATVTAMSKSIT